MMSPIIFFLLGAAIFLLSFLSISSPGIGLLGRPLLLLAGLSPAISIGSFRIANFISKIAGFLSIFQKGSSEIDWKSALVLFLPSFLGGILGAEIVLSFNSGIIKMLLGIFILFMGILLVLNKEVVFKESKTSFFRRVLGILGAIIIGVISCFVGGSGILLIYLMAFLHNKNYLSSSMNRKIANFGSALSSSVLFIYYNIVDWHVMVLLVFAGGLGQYLGSRYRMKKQEKWIRWLSLVLVFATGIALIIF